MKREKLLTRQGGERQLGLTNLHEDIAGACMRLKNSPVKRHREHAAKFRLESEAIRDHHVRHESFRTRECVAKTLQILEDDWIPLQNNDDDDYSLASGMPSLASINPGSIAGESTSLHSSSRSGLSKFSSMTSTSSHCYSQETEDNISFTSRSSMVSEPTLRQRMSAFLLEDINEDVRAETLDCLEPVLLASSRDSSRHEKTRWGSPPSCDTDITVCRPQELLDAPTSISARTKHELASRNADEAPSLPPRVDRVLSLDQSPMLPRRYPVRQEFQPPTPPGGLDRSRSIDQTPFQPRRKGSNSRSCVSR